MNPKPILDYIKIHTDATKAKHQPIKKTNGILTQNLNGELRIWRGRDKASFYIHAATNRPKITHAPEETCAETNQQWKHKRKSLQNKTRVETT